MQQQRVTNTLPYDNVYANDNKQLGKTQINIALKKTIICIKTFKCISLNKKYLIIIIEKGKHPFQIQ